MADPLTTLFISYAHTDSAFVDRLDADLRAQGLDTWIDRERLVAGLRWRRELQEAVERAQVMLIVLSPEAIDSHNVQIEYDYALDLRKVVIPIYYRQCNVPMELRAIQWIDFRQSYEQGIAALVQVLHMQQDKATPLPPSEQTRPGDLVQQPSQNEPAAAGKPIFNNLPAQPTPFIGREQEVVRACEFLSRPEIRLLTLTGPGGIGKTRLALQVAARLSDHFIDGTCFVALAPVSEAELVVPTIMQTLSIKETGGQLLLAQLKAGLKDKQMLLVLDNFEQVVDAAVQVAELLVSCPKLKLIITSRVVLHIQAEREFDVPPLSLPNPKCHPDLVSLSQYEAVALFIQRAQALKPDFQVTNANAPAVAGICARLDGLPLAIELAAARVKFFAPQVLFSRLEQGLVVLTGGARDLPARQQTLRGAISWSYDLLSPAEQQLFRRLAVFVDGCTIDAAEVVCRAAGALAEDVVDGLLSLVDKSLLRQQESTQGEPRFAMLQLLREFGLEMLALAEESESTRQAHAEYFLALAEQAKPQLQGSEQAYCLARLQQEHENLLVALNFLLQRAKTEGISQAERALRLCLALDIFWWRRGYLREGWSFLEQALAIRQGVTPLVQANILLADVDYILALLGVQQAEKLGKEALALYRESGDTAGIADSLMQLAYIARMRSQYAMARNYLQEAVPLYKGLNKDSSRCLNELALVFNVQGEYSQALRLLDECLVLARTNGNTAFIAWILFCLAYVLFLSQADLAQVHPPLEKSLALYRELEDRWHIAYGLWVLAEMHLVQNEVPLARELFEEIRATFREMGTWWEMIQTQLSLARVYAVQDDLAIARNLYQESLVASVEKDDKYSSAACLEGFARVIARQGKVIWAARLWGAAEALREAMGAPIHRVYRAEYEQMVALARAQASEGAFVTAWAEGREMPLEQILDSVTLVEGQVEKIQASSGIRLKLAPNAPALDTHSGQWGIVASGGNANELLNWAKGRSDQPLLVPPGTYDIIWQQDDRHEPLPIKRNVTVKEQSLTEVEIP